MSDALAEPVARKDFDGTGRAGVARKDFDGTGRAGVAGSAKKTPGVITGG